jgi:hypothetical protein
MTTLPIPQTCERCRFSDIYDSSNGLRLCHYKPPVTITGTTAFTSPAVPVEPDYTCSAWQQIPAPDVTAFNVGKHRVLQRIASFLALDDRKVIELARQQQDQEQHDAA